MATENIAPSWYRNSVREPTFRFYRPGARFLPHQLRYSFARAALQECQITQKQQKDLSPQQIKEIDTVFRKERKYFISFDIVGYIAMGLNVATFVPLLVQAVRQPSLPQNLALIWLGAIDQIVWLVYAIGLRSLPILILSLILIPLFVALLILVYQNRN